MIRLKEKMMPMKKRKWMNLEFSHNSQVLMGHKRTKPLIIKALMGKTLIHRVYVDNGSSVNIIYEHCLDQLPPYVKVS